MAGWADLKGLSIVGLFWAGLGLVGWLQGLYRVGLFFFGLFWAWQGLNTLLQEYVNVCMYEGVRWWWWW